MDQENERIRSHNAEMEAEDRARLAELWGEEDADALLFRDPVDERVDLAIGRVMDQLEVACSWSLIPPARHDGAAYLLLVRPWSRSLARRLRRAVASVGESVEVRPQ